jgi:hypothetical protein
MTPSIISRLSAKLRSTVHVSDPALGLVKMELQFSRDPALAPHGSALLKLLYGGATCHRDSGFPHERLSRLGCLEGATIRLGDETAPIAWLAIRDSAAIRVSADEFEVPAGYTIVERGKVPPLARHPHSAAAGRSASSRSTITWRRPNPACRHRLEPAGAGGRGLGHA